ncbi:MAG TPA: tetratricopeptide repeat protein, partial [Geobacteraceae bacterium]
PFTFDDITSIVDNPIIRDAGNFLGRADGYRYNPRRFVAYLTFALNYRAGGLGVAGYHVVNLVIHLITALLVYAWTRLTLATPRLAESRFAPCSRSISLVAALLFVAHPLATQAVTYVVQRSASLATLFYLLALVCYAAARSEQERLRRLSSPRVLFLFGATVLASGLALRTKEIAVTLPFALLLYEGMFFPRTRRKRLLIGFGTLGGALLFLAVALSATRPLGEFLADVGQSLAETRVISRSDYLLTQFRVLVTYVRLLFMPVAQNLDYAYPIATSLFDPAVCASLFFLLGLLACAVVLLVRAGRGGEPLLRLVAFGIFWFFLTLAVESSIIPITDVIFEHRLYLPLAGVAMAAGAGCFLLGRRLPVVAGRLLLVALVLALALATWRRNAVWGDNVALWRDVVAKSPAKARSHNELGKALYDGKRYAEAVVAYREAIRLDPAFLPAHNNLGAALHKLGDVDGAIAAYEAALRLEPRQSETLNNLAIAHERKGLVDLSIAEYESVLKMRPDYAAAHNNLGAAYRKKGNIPAAMEQYRIALRLKPDYASAYNNLGVAYALQGNYAEAAEQFTTALRLQPDNGEFRENLAKVYDLRGEKEKAAGVRAGRGDKGEVER